MDAVREHEAAPQANPDAHTGAVRTFVVPLELLHADA